jgi:D-3-phosphoglycerate dehydrogenase
LLAHARVVATPHLGASTEEAQEKVAVQIAHQVADALHGRAFTGVVNATVMHLTLKEEVRPYLVLAERMGSLLSQLAQGKLRKISVGGAGEAVVSTLDLLRAGVLKGVLSHVQPEPVNFISAPLLAAELGLAVQDSREPDPGAYQSLLRVRYETDRETHEAAGTVFGVRGVRLVYLDGFSFEVNPEGSLLVYSNTDMPGMLARVGARLAAHKVNIAGVSLGRTGAGARALTVMNTDGPPSAAAMEEVQGLEGVTGVRWVTLDERDGIS